MCATTSEYHENFCDLCDVWFLDKGRKPSYLTHHNHQSCHPILSHQLQHRLFLQSNEDCLRGAKKWRGVCEEYYGRLKSLNKNCSPWRINFETCHKYVFFETLHGVVDLFQVICIYLHVLVSLKIPPSFCPVRPGRLQSITQNRKDRCGLTTVMLWRRLGRTVRKLSSFLRIKIHGSKYKLLEINMS